MKGETAMNKSQYTKQMLLFKDISGKEVQADFEGGEVSSDGGLLFLREVEKRVGVIRRMADVLQDCRHPGYVKHEIKELLQQRVYQITCGYEDADDSDELRNDPILKMACERLPISDSPLASQPTMSRFENGISRTDLYRIADVFLEIFIDSYESAPEGIILDIDDTDDETHGHQQLSLFNGYHDSYCYMPIHIYEGKSGRLVTTVLRPGKRPTGKEIFSILKRVVKRIRESWPEVGILLRGDSHYSCPEVYEFCKEQDIKFALGFKFYPPLQEKVESLIEEAKRRFALEKQPVTIFGECFYRAESWEEAQRVIVKVEYSALGLNVRFIVTNLEHWNRRFIYQTAYCGRGRMELLIKEHKNHLFSDRTSCSRFEANQFRLFLHSIAYVLLHTFRRFYLKGSEWAYAQFDTIRLKLIKIGARVRQLATKIKVHLPSSFPFKEELQRIWLSCWEGGYP
jgi:hypothetical protein